MSQQPLARRPRWRLLVAGVRGRSVLASVVVVGVALALGALLFVVQLQRVLVSGVEQSATSQVLRVAQQVREDGPTALADDVSTSTRGGQVVQVLGDDGAIVASSSARAARRPLTRVRPAPGRVVVELPGRLPLVDDDDEYLLAVTTATSSSSGVPYRVVVAAPIEAQQESVRTALSLLLVGLPPLVLLAGAATWWLVGRALSPVERMRARVSAIGGSRVRERLDVPATSDEIARLALTMNEMLARLDRAGQVQRQFVADAGHELRSPLATLTAAVEVARREPDASGRADLSDVMAAELDRLGRLVDDLLLLARVDEQALTAAQQDVDLDDLVHEQRSRLLAHPGLTVEVAAEPTRVRGDRARLAQVLTNLVDNAVRHTHSLVRIVVRTDGDHVLLVVEDDGPGIPREHRPRVFERFVRLDDSRVRSSGGSGLGLAIVAEIVRAHRGTVGVGDRLGGGCRVEVRLPAEVPLATGPAQPPSSSRR